MSDSPASSSNWLTSRVGKFLEGSDDLKTPDVTKIQALALAQAFIAVLVVLGVNPPDDVQQTIIGLSVVLGAALPLSDAAVRRQRAQNADKITEARKAMQTLSVAAMASEARSRRALEAAELQLAEAEAAAAAPAAVD